MGTFLKKNIATVLILGATVILAGIAIFTAVRLYQLRQQAVSPTAPESRPAAQVAPTPDPCELKFTTGIPLCTEKVAYRNYVGGNSSTFGARITASDTVAAGEIFIYQIALNNPTETAATYTVTDVLDTDLTYVDSPQTTVQYDPATRTVTATGSLPANSTGAVTFRVSVNAGATGSIANSGVFTPETGSPTTCSLDLNIVGSSPTPTPTATATPRTTPTATPTPAPTPVGCNDTCTTNSDCTGNLICSSGRCRNAQCTSEADCVCGTPTPTPRGSATPKPSVTPAPELPEAGVSAPTIIGASAGILLLIGALLLAL